MRYKFKIPTPSAKRLEKDRCFVIEETVGCWGTKPHEFPIPEGAEDAEFDFEFEDNDEFINQDILDANVYYSWYVRYRNSTGSREEKIKVEFEELH